MLDKELNPKRCVQDMHDHPWEPRCTFFLHDQVFHGILSVCTCSGTPVPVELSHMKHNERVGCNSYRGKRTIVETQPEEVTG